MAIRVKVKVSSLYIRNSVSIVQLPNLDPEGNLHLLSPAHALIPAAITWGIGVVNTFIAYLKLT